MMKRYLTLIVLVLTLAVPAAAAAQAQPAKPAATDEFVPVTGTPQGAQETIPAQRLVGIAYGFIWVVLFGYVWSVRSRLSRVEHEIEAVSRRVPERK